MVGNEWTATFSPEEKPSRDSDRHKDLNEPHLDGKPVSSNAICLTLDSKPIDHHYLTITTIGSDKRLVNSSHDKSETTSRCSISTGITEKSPFNFSRRQTLTLVALAYGNFCLGSLYAIQAPFFPKVAESKGITPTQYGLIFGVFEFGMFLLAPLFGKMIPHVTPKFLINTGLFIAGWCCLLFGFLQWSPPGMTFFTLAFVMRIFEAVGGAAFFTACYTTIAVDFPDRIPQLFATTEMCFGIGMIIGPALGGVLFEVGNFCLPFFVLGAMTIFAGIATFYILPDSENAKRTEKTGILNILSNFGVTLNVIISMSTFLCIGFNDATLEHHIRENITSLSPSVTGAIFLIAGLFYAVCNQFWGYWAEKTTNAHPICIIGYVAGIGCFALSGPLYGLPLQPNIWLVVVSQMLMGIAMGGQLVGSFTEGLRETIKAGLPDTISTFALISGIYASAFSLGASIGPAIGGYLMDNFGYRKACYALVLLQIVMITTVVLFNVIRSTSEKGNLKVNPYISSKKSVDASAGMWETCVKPRVRGISIVRRNMM